MNRITINEAKSRISIVEYLAAHGHHTLGKTGQQHRFKSVFREEKVPSMFVNDEKGLWNDFGHGGGSIIDLAMQLHNFTTIPQVLEHLTTYLKVDRSSFEEKRVIKPTSNRSGIAASLLTNIKIQPLNHFVLLQYLEKERGIDKKLAQRYLHLVWYDRRAKKNLFAIGWKNDSGSYELRSAGKTDFKTVTGEKDLTTIINNATIRKVYVFESMLDYLSALMMKNQFYLEGTVYILNSTNLIKRVIPLLEKGDFEIIHTFLDNDKAGEKAMNYLLEALDKAIINPQVFYKGFNDVNDFWVSTVRKKK